MSLSSCLQLHTRSNSRRTVQCPLSHVQCCTTVGTSCTTNPQQTEVMELEGYSRPTCNGLCASSNDALTVVGVVNKLDRRRVLLTTRSFCPGKRFQSPEFVAKFLIFTGTQISLQHSVGHVEGSSDAKTSSIRPDILIKLLTCEGETQTETETAA